LAESEDECLLNGISDKPAVTTSEKN